MVRIRMKSFGRRHRPFFRICAMDARSPRDGRAIEELGHYDPMVRNIEAQTVLNASRIRYWLSVGAAEREGAGALEQGRDQEARARRALAAPRDPGRDRDLDPGADHGRRTAAPAPAAAGNPDDLVSRDPARRCRRRRSASTC